MSARPHGAAADDIADAERGAEHYDLASCTYRGERCFAVRGGLGFAGPVRLLHPAGAKDAAMKAVGGFLRALGCEVRVEADGDSAKLVKKLG